MKEMNRRKIKMVKMTRTMTTVSISILSIFCMLFFVGASLQALEGKLPLEKGMVDFGSLRSMEAKVEVNISGSLLNMASKIMANQEPKVAKILLDLKGVYVRIFENLAGENPEDIVKNYEKKLGVEGWETVVRVREKDDNVMILTLADQNLIKGLFVATSSKNELVLVNLFGNINPEDLAYLAKGKLPIPGLQQLGKFPPAEGKAKTKAKSGQKGDKEEKEEKENEESQSDSDKSDKSDKSESESEDKK
jgi:hypothetical protein